MSDRAAEARAEAERHPQAQGLEDTIEDFMTGISTYGNLSDIDRQMAADLADFLAEQGVVWTGTNPKPRTITEDEFNRARNRYWEYLDAGEGAYLAHKALVHMLGIEVTDDE